MKKSLLTIFLALTCSNAIAEWAKVNANDEFSTYADRSSILKKGHYAKLMSMYDYKSVQTHLSDSFLYLSTQQQGEYDCKAEKSRILANSLHYKKMGTGKSIHYKSRPLEWTAISPDGIDETLLRIACGKTKLRQYPLMPDQRLSQK